MFFKLAYKAPKASSTRSAEKMNEAYRQLVEAVQLLIDAGCDVNIRDDGKKQRSTGQTFKITGRLPLSFLRRAGRNNFKDFRDQMTKTSSSMEEDVFVNGRNIYRFFARKINETYYFFMNVDTFNPKHTSELYCKDLQSSYFTSQIRNIICQCENSEKIDKHLLSLGNSVK